MDKVIGNCSKHPGHNFVNCPLCEIERQKKLSKNFWDNVQKDVERVNTTPEGVSADLLEKLKDDTHDAIWDSIYAEGGEVGGGNKAVEKCVEIAIEYASLVSSSDKKEIARLKEDVKELVGCLDAYPGIYAMQFEPDKMGQWINNLTELIQKHKL